MSYLRATHEGVCDHCGKHQRCDGEARVPHGWTVVEVHIAPTGEPSTQHFCRVCNRTVPELRWLIQGHAIRLESGSALGDDS